MLPGILTGSLILAVLAMLLPTPAHAQSTWNTTTGSWNTSASWSPAGVPVNDGSAFLSFGGSTSYTTTNNLGTFRLNQLRFTNSANTVTLAGTAGNPLSFGLSRDLKLPTLTLAGPGNATVSAPVFWDADTTTSNSGSGTLLLSGTQTYLNGTRHTFTNAGNGTLTLADGITYANSTTGTGGLVLNFVNNNPAAGTFNIGDMGGLDSTTFNIGGTGTVRFNGSGGDLFSGDMLLNVQAGATFDFNGNAETMGAISGAGTLVLSTSVTLDPVVGGQHVFSGRLTGSGGTLTVSDVSETLVLSGSTSDYTTATLVVAGRLIVSGNAPNGAAGALGNATSDVLVGNTSGSSMARLLIGEAGVSIGRNVRLQSGNTGVATIGGVNTSGTATYSGSIILGTDGAAAKGVSLYAAKGGTVEFTGAIVRAATATGTTDTLTISGAGTVALRGSNTFTGATVVNGGTLLLDYSSNNDSKVSSTAALSLSGGSLAVLGSSAAGTTVSLGGLNVGSSAAPFGGGEITVTSGQDQNTTLALGAITKNAGGTVNFVLANTGSGVASITTTTANNATGILGAHATFALNDWAVSNGAAGIGALGAGSYSATFGTGLNSSRGSSTALPAGGATTSTLRLTGAAAITFNASANTLTLENGGILVASTAGATSFGTTSIRGVISSGTGELIIHQHSASTLTINSVISGTTLTKSGEGALVLTASNTYTGNTIINGGSISVTAALQLGVATADVTLNGGTLVLPSGTLGTLNAANRVITIGAAGATFNFTANQVMEGSGLAGTGTLTLAGSGTISVGSSASTFNGDIVINNGTLKMNSQQFNSVPSIIVNSGGTYEVNDDSVGTFGAAAGGRILLNGNGYGNNGALRVTDQNTNTAFADPRTIIANEVVLQTTARIQVDNGVAANSNSLLTLAGVVSGSGGFVKAGTGTLALSGRDNTFSGNVSVEAGILSLLGNDRLPVTAGLNLGAGSGSGILQLNGYSQTLSSLGSSGTGSENTVISGSATASSVLTLNISSTQTYGGTLGGSGVANTHANNNVSLSKTGAGSLTLEKASTHIGVTNVAQGTLVLGHAGALGSGGFSLAAGDAGTYVQAGATLDLNGQSNVQEVITLNGSGVAGMGALVNNSTTPASLGNGVASVSFSGSTTGWTLATAATIASSSGGTDASIATTIGLGAGTFTITNGGSGYGLTPQVTLASTGTGAVVSASVGVTNASFTVTPGTTTYTIAPTVTFSNGATGVAVLDGAGLVTGINITSPGGGFTTTPTATFSGGSVLAAGTNPKASGNNNNYTVVGINIVNPGMGFTSVPSVTIASGTGGTATAVGSDNFALNGIAITDGGSGYTSAPTVSLNGGSATATGNITRVELASDSAVGGSGELAIHAVISGTGGLTKVGTSATTLTGSNTYTGTTLLSEGTLQVGLAGHGRTGSGLVTVDGAAAVLAGTGSIENTATIIRGTLKPGDNNGMEAGTLSTKSLVFTPASSTTVVEMQLMSASEFDVLSIQGDLTLNASSNILVVGAGYTAAVGDSFTLLDWSGVVSRNGFSTGSQQRTGSDADGNEGNLNLPDITGIGFWQISDMLDSGALTLTIIAAVPEPTRGMLMLAGGAALLLLRRRRRSVLKRQ